MEIERAKAIKISTDWEEVRRELDSWILNQLNRTKTCSPEDLGRIQAKISAYEEVKDLPQVVIDREE